VRGGLYLEQIARERDRPIPFYGELGSINPVFVTAAAVAARGAEIVDGFVGSYTLGNGQFCTKPGLLFLPAGHGLPQHIVAAAGKVTTGRLLTDSIADGFRERTHSLTADIDGAMVLESADRDGCPQPGLMSVDFDTFLQHADNIRTEAFGPFSAVVEYTDAAQLRTALDHLDGSLTVTVHAEEQDRDLMGTLLPVLEAKAGRLIVNEWPTGVAVTPAQQHGGPYPSTTSVLHTSVGTAAVDRFLRPVAYQNFPESWLPAPLQDANPWHVPQLIGEPGRSQEWGRSAGTT
jgi:NADP-dependent aldehyde dehydrogenase